MKITLLATCLLFLGVVAHSKQPRYERSSVTFASSAGVKTVTCIKTDASSLEFCEHVSRRNSDESIGYISRSCAQQARSSRKWAVDALDCSDFEAWNGKVKSI